MCDVRKYSDERTSKSEDESNLDVGGWGDNKLTDCEFVSKLVTTEFVSKLVTTSRGGRGDSVITTRVPSVLKIIYIKWNLRRENAGDFADHDSMMSNLSRIRNGEPFL